MLAERSGGAWRVALFEAKASVGRKFLVAGRGGLNLTHAEDRERFVRRYGTDSETVRRWADLLTEFGPEDLRAWATGLGIETFVGTSGRVFPVGKQAAGLLRRWVARLRERGVEFRVRHRWEGLHRSKEHGRWRLTFTTADADAQRVELDAAAVVFALGGASWPETGSDGRWTEFFRDGGGLGVPVAPWQAANCGWEVDWRPEFLAVVEGRPLKNIALRVGDTAGEGGPAAVRGEALITRYGLEGGAIYQLGPALRAGLSQPGDDNGDEKPRVVWLDLKPDLDAAALTARLSPADVRKEDRGIPLDALAAHWRLSLPARALLEFHGPGRCADRATWLAAVKGLPLPLRGPRPVAEAISSAGGVRWEAVDATTLALRNHPPGIFLAGEMLDWEAPTGGYLLQGCFATGTRAGRAAAEHLGVVSGGVVEWRKPRSGLDPGGGTLFV